METPWRYRCSICGELVEPGAAMTVHLEKHRAAPDWQGLLTWTRVDDDEEE